MEKAALLRLLLLLVVVVMVVVGLGVGSLCFTACCQPENKQASDNDINANLNASQ